MPTGYTAGILDGSTKDFNQFAKHCSRAFIIHLRDEPMDSEYKKREPSGYHTKAIDEARRELKRASTLTDKEIISREKETLSKSRIYHLNAIEKDKSNVEKMNLFLEKARAYNPPTEKHNGIADFMVEQLEKTIDFDCNSNYHIKELEKIESKLQNLNAANIRSEIKEKAAKEIEYHTKEHEEDLRRCEDHNKWYEDFINSLK